MTSPIFIVGMYKCGTSWLLSALAEHPDIEAYRELDIVRCIYDVKGEKITLNDAEERFKYFLSRYPYSRLQEDTIKALYNPKLQINVVKELVARPESKKTFSHLNLEEKLGILSHIKNDKPAKLIKNFVKIHQRKASHVVFKSADQLPVSHLMRKVLPKAKHVVIMRDGRDAAVSALFFRELMAKSNVPWRKNKDSIPIDELFLGWRNRARILKRKIENNENLYVVRYEDLIRDFKRSLAKLFEYCDIDFDENLLGIIEDKTSFKAQTGRRPGEESKDVIRKGIVGDWKNYLSDGENEKIWELGGEELQSFGYTFDGTIEEKYTYSY